MPKILGMRGGGVLVFDVGTSSGKVCALDDDGRVLGIESEGYPTRVPRPAWAEQDPTNFLPELALACRRLLARLGLDPSRVRGLAVTCAAQVGVLLDASGEPARAAILWHDPDPPRVHPSPRSAQHRPVLSIAAQIGRLLPEPAA
jgi:sugar (pentulose or hexulose) kinase